MDINLYKEEILQIKQQYSSYQLTDEQAVRIWKHYNATASISAENWLTKWEQYDYDHHIFKKILDAEQFALYQKKRTADIEHTIAFLKQQDEKIKPNIDYQQELLTYYADIYIPQLLQVTLKYPLPFNEYRSKIHFIKEEYRSFLNESKRMTAIQHFRNYRSYSPDLFQLHMLDVQLLHVMPNYQKFNVAADTPTQAALQFTLEKAAPYWTSFIDFFNDMEAEELKIKKSAALRFFGKTEINGWHVEKPAISEIEYKNQQLFLLLMAEKSSYNREIDD
ncbi:hypothetical protein [Niabella beijingensis]|uniref:hypothetical protein n=1 Tax=Niabella beijingensis TaxID=2872700 RepID=UPI001CBDD639|nr:hypothetical protein [Niabella beijingensis]MBZ4187412.1 hypothetical protein [Niabella beijingensis]